MNKLNVIINVCSIKIIVCQYLRSRFTHSNIIMYKHLHNKYIYKKLPAISVAAREVHK